MYGGFRQELGGTSRQRLITLAESAIRGMNIPNPNDYKAASTPSDFVGVSDALAEEKVFREFLEKEGVTHPEKLTLGSPRAAVNRLVASELGMTAGRLSWWDWLDLRVRIWIQDSSSRLLWWWMQRTSYTDKDVG